MDSGIINYKEYRLPMEANFSVNNEWIHYDCVKVKIGLMKMVIYRSHIDI